MYFDPAIFNNTNYKLLLIFAYSLVATMVALPYVIKKCFQHGYIVKDMHKIGYPMVPVLGGIALLAGIFVSLALSQILLPDQFSLGHLFIFYFVVLIYGMYGLLDDIFHFKARYSKILVLLVLSLPIGSLLITTILDLKFASIDLGLVYTLLFAPIYIMVVANLINLHAGFNGLGPGSTLIMLIAAGVKSYLVHGTTYLMYLMPILGAMAVFYWYNKYPAKVFDGNIGAFVMGSALGAFLIVNHLEIFGVVILVPHIITFVLDTWVIGIMKVPDKEFPKPRKDGLIIIDKTMRYKSFKNVICTWFTVTEKQATNILLLITALFCVIGVILI
jgi:UDP-N-acetylglucosamine--dolichyl-phosphate N-acetylglucosaminephosphotransferase